MAAFISVVITSATTIHFPDIDSLPVIFHSLPPMLALRRSRAVAVPPLLIRGRRGFWVIGFQASNQVSRPVSRQDLRKIGLETAFELLFLLGTEPFGHL